MFPIRDTQRSYSAPFVTILLIVTNLVIFLYEISLDAYSQSHFTAVWALVPARFHAIDLLTSMFLHGGWMHVLGNMWFLWIFGDNIEEHLSTVRFVIFYLVVGIASALAQAFSLPSSTLPMIGASGAIAGVLGGYLMLFPRAKIVTFIPIPLLWPVIDVPAWVFLGLWFFGQFFISSGSNVAWMAHVGGFLAGLGLIRLLAKTRPQSPTAAPDVEYLPPPRRNQSW